MKATVVRYKVKADRAEENIGYIKKVFEQLQRESPNGLRYCSFQLDDGVSFIHVVALDDSIQSNPLAGISAFKDFASNIAERCVESPQPVPARLIGAYQTFGA